MKNTKEPQIKKGRVEELQRILKEEYGKEVTFEEATKITHDLVGYFDLLARLDFEHQENQFKK